MDSEHCIVYYLLLTYIVCLSVFSVYWFTLSLTETKV